MSSTDLGQTLKTLRLSGLWETLDIRVQQAVEEGLDLHEFLFRLLQDEVDRRGAKSLERRVKLANFEGPKSLDSFDFKFNSTLPRNELIEIATCRFMDAHENVILVGPAGVGKSHMAQAIGQRACRAGRTVLYVTAHQILADLRAARADHTWNRRIEKFAAVDLLIIDDLGLRPLALDEPVDLYELIRRRYERGSMIVTSNRDISEWYPMFGDSLLASSAMDRLLHHSRVIVMDGHSYRNPPNGQFGRTENSTNTKKK